MTKTVIGLFDDATKAHNVVQELIDTGFHRDAISLAALNPGSDPDSVELITDGAVAGATTGALYGGGIGLLIGLSALAVPGVGPVLVGGALVTALAGAGVGATAGGLLGALTDVGVTEEEARLYAEGVRRGGTLVTVTAPGEMADRATRIMHAHGAADTDKLAARYRESGSLSVDSNQT